MTNPSTIFKNPTFSTNSEDGNSEIESIELTETPTKPRTIYPDPPSMNHSLLSLPSSEASLTLPHVLVTPVTALQSTQLYREMLRNVLCDSYGCVIRTITTDKHLYTLVYMELETVFKVAVNISQGMPLDLQWSKPCQVS